MSEEIKSRICTKCKVEKEFSFFYKVKNSKDGLDKWCSECRKSHNNHLHFIRKDKKLNPEKYIKEEVLTKVCNRCKKEKDICLFRQKTLNPRLYSNCQDCRLEYDKELYAKERASLGLKVKPVRPPGSVSKEQKHEEMLETCRRYRARHPERRRKSARDWNRRNMDRLVENNRIRYHNDPIFNLKTKIRKRIWSAIKKSKNGTRKADRTIKLLGCSFLELKAHIENLLEPQMSWNDVMTSKINLDHIIPLSSFNLINPEEQKKAFHFTNLAPRWITTDVAKENGSNQIGNLNKGSKILTQEQLLAEKVPLDFHEVLL